MVLDVPTGGGRRWVELARAREQQGWDAVGVPDTLWTPAPFAALAAAGAVTSTLRLRSWVLAAPLRTPAATVREVRALQELTDGRYELGIGTGRPDAAGEAATLGAVWPAAQADRARHLADVVARVRSDVSPRPTVAITASGPRMTATAIRLLTGPDATAEDRLALALAPDTDDAALAERVRQVRESAPGVRMTYQLCAIGDRVPDWLARNPAWSAASLADRGAVGALPGDPELAADVLGRWPDRYGIDEVVVPAELADAAEPVLRRLRG